MTTLAIIGGGIMGRSLLYTLAKEENCYSKVCLFSSDNITAPCTLHSTAIAASRGVTIGHSTLGDELVKGFKFFHRHIDIDRPDGVQKIFQYTVATKEIENFRKRYSNATLSSHFLKESSCLATEEAFMIDPQNYLKWLTDKAVNFFADRLSFVEDFVYEVQVGEKIKILTLNGNAFYFDQVVFCCGSYNRFWKNNVPDSRLQTSRPVQGSYLEFTDIFWNHPSFSLTIDGDNIVWNAPFKRLFIGSTSKECSHQLSPQKELYDIYDRLRSQSSLDLPKKELGKIRVGLREKAQKREPYVIFKDRIVFVGGLYKNAFTLSLKIAKEIAHQLLVNASRTL